MKTPGDVQERIYNSIAVQRVFSLSNIEELTISQVDQLVEAYKRLLWENHIASGSLAISASMRRDHESRLDLSARANQRWDGVERRKS